MASSISQLDPEGHSIRRALRRNRRPVGWHRSATPCDEEFVRDIEEGIIGQLLAIAQGSSDDPHEALARAISWARAAQRYIVAHSPEFDEPGERDDTLARLSRIAS